MLCYSLNHALLQKYVGIDCAFPGGDNRIGMMCALIKRKALHHFNFSRVIAALVQLLFIAIPDSRLARIAINHFHQRDRLFHILIQRQKLQDGLQQFYGSVPVCTNHNGIFADAFSREISVCENDFGLLDTDGHLLANPVHYRDARTNGKPEQAAARMPAEELYAHTGNQIMAINTLFQLLALREQDPELLQKAEQVLFMPDLFAPSSLDSPLWQLSAVRIGASNSVPSRLHVPQERNAVCSASSSAHGIEAEAHCVSCPATAMIFAPFASVPVTVPLATMGAKRFSGKP